VSFGRKRWRRPDKGVKSPQKGREKKLDNPGGATTEKTVGWQNPLFEKRGAARKACPVLRKKKPWDVQDTAAWREGGGRPKRCSSSLIRKPVKRDRSTRGEGPISLYEGGGHIGQRGRSAPRGDWGGAARVGGPLNERFSEGVGKGGRVCSMTGTV